VREELGGEADERGDSRSDQRCGGCVHAFILGQGSAEPMAAPYPKHRALRLDSKGGWPPGPKNEPLKALLSPVRG
jgi:hypothetical protein